MNATLRPTLWERDDVDFRFIIVHGSFFGVTKV
jgi:hypothetical protein